MRISLLERRSLGVVALLVGLAFSGVAHATPIYTYEFELTGFKHYLGSSLPQAVVKGSFSGTLDPSGDLLKSAVTAFHLEVSGFSNPDHNRTTDVIPDFFLYTPHLNTFSLVDFYTDPGDTYALCIGGATGVACNGGSALGALAYLPFGQDPIYFSQRFMQAFTDSRPVVSLVSVATTPIPGAAILFGTALAGIAGFGAARRRGLRPA
jgi:hypothetical protein